jgi:hypothetical protein
MAVIDELSPENCRRLRECIAKLPLEISGKIRGMATVAGVPAESVFLHSLTLGFLAQPPEVRLKRMRDSGFFAGADDAALGGRRVSSGGPDPPAGPRFPLSTPA